MFKKIFVAGMVALLTASALALAPNTKKFGQKEAQSLDTDTWIDANQLLMFVTNKGSFAYDQGGLFGKNDGLYFPYTNLQAIQDKVNTTSVLFASGIWVAAVDNASGDTLVTGAEYADDYFPGPIVGGTFVPNADNLPQYRVYKLYVDSLAGNPNQDYLDWPVAQGAPVDSLGNPQITGDQMCWSVYNDVNPAYHTNDLASDSGLGVEIRQSTFAFSREGALANVIFLRFQIYNKGGRDLSNMRVTLWSDPDLGDAGDDFVGSDTILSLAYCYNATANDASYGNTPPSVGYDFFQGPLVFTGNNADTAIMWNFQKFVGYQNMPMTAMMMYRNGEDPASPTETYQYMAGLLAKQGGIPLPNGTPFYAPGDPVTGTGDLDVNASDRRYMLTTGPFDFPSGDSTEVVAAIVVGQGADNLNSITQLRLIDEFAQSVYDRGFVLPDPPAPPVVAAAELDGQIVLTWGTESEVDPGDYQFEGYAVFQGASLSGPWTDTLAWFDYENGVAAIIDSFFNLVTGNFFPRIVKPGRDRGLQRYLKVTTDQVNGGPLRNYTNYFFRVEAYSFDTLAVKGERTLTSATVIAAKPESPLVGVNLNSDVSDDIVATHSAGLSDGSVTATIFDPGAITGDDYRVSFFIDTAIVPDSIDTTVVPPDTVTYDTTIAIAWNLVNVTTGDTMIHKWFNQENTEDFPVVDGMLVKVTGPAPGFKDFQVVENGNGPINPPAGGAFDFGGFPSIRPDATQQLGGGLWGFHTGDNGGSCAGGTYGGFSAFLTRVLRNDNSDRLGSYDWEMRFTGDTTAGGVYDSSLGGGSIAIRAFQDDYVTWVPFELWRTGIGTPTDPSDDVRLVVWHLDNADDSTYNLESWGCADSAVFGAGGEHSVSGGDDDPYTDWIYWFVPLDETPGQSGYQQSASEMLAGTYAFGDMEVMARTVLVSWNGGSAPPFTQALPEPGTVFRIITNKPNALSDEFTFSTAAFSPSVASSGPESLLDNIKAVPNPYYLSSSYDLNTTNRRMKFTNLPATCTITIYNLAGHFVERIDKTDVSTSETTWDLTNESNIPVASGIYIYVVEAPGFGQKIGKMAIFTEIEVLGQY